MLCKNIIPTLASLLAISATWSCATFPNETATRDAVTEHVGVYPPAPHVNIKPRVGVPPFEVRHSDIRYGELANVAADQLTTLAQRSRRFKMIERTQLEALLIEQDLEGIVDSGELARMARVQGVDLILIGKIDDFRMKRERKSDGISGNIPSLFGALGGKKASYKNNASRLTVECGVDLRLVDPETGEIAVAHFSQYKKSDTAGGFGIRFDGTEVESENEFQISQDSQGKVLRLALDDALRRMLPDVDEYLFELSDLDTAQNGEGTADGQGPRVAASVGFCSACGEKRSGAFCKSCGSKHE